MSTHYITCLPVAILGAFLVVVSQAFSPDVVGWVAFGVGIGIASIVVLAQLDGRRGSAQRVIDLGVFALAVLLVVFDLVASGTTVIWLSFGFALGAAALGVSGLTLHEVSTWRGEHHLSSLHWLPEPDVAAMRPQTQAA